MEKWAVPDHAGLCRHESFSLECKFFIYLHFLLPVLVCIFVFSFRFIVKVLSGIKQQEFAAANIEV